MVQNQPFVQNPRNTPGVYPSTQIAPNQLASQPNPRDDFYYESHHTWIHDPYHAHALHAAMLHPWDSHENGLHPAMLHPWDPHEHGLHPAMLHPWYLHAAHYPHFPYAGWDHTAVDYQHDGYHPWDGYHHHW